MPAVVTSSSTLPVANPAKTGQHALDRAVAQGVGYERPLPGSARAAVAGEFLAASVPSAAAKGASGGKLWGEEGGWVKRSKEEVRFRKLPVANDAFQASGPSQARPILGGGSGPSTVAAQPTPVVKNFRPINPPAVASNRPSQEDLVGKTTPATTPSAHVQNPSHSSGRAAGSTSKVDSTVSSPGAARTKVKLSLAGARPSLPPSATTSSLLSQSTVNIPREKDRDKSVKRRRSDGELKDGAKSSKEASGENGGEKKKKKHRESHVEDGSGTRMKVKLKKTSSANDGLPKLPPNNVPPTVLSTSPLLGTTAGLQPSSKPSSISSGTSSKTLSAGITGITTSTSNVFPKQTPSPLSRLANESSSTSSATKRSRGKEVEKIPPQNSEDSDEIEELDSSLITHNTAFGPLKPVEEAFREVDALLSKPRSEHRPSSSSKPSPSAPSSSATTVTPSGMLGAPVSLSSTATSGVSGTSLSSYAGSGPTVSEDEKAQTTKRSSNMLVLPPAIEIEGSSDESILMMDAIVLSSSDDDMDVDSWTEERERAQQAKMKKEMERLKEQQRTVNYFQGKVEMIVGTEEKRMGTLKIVSAKQGEYEMKIDLLRDIVSVSNASVEKAHLDAEARTMECHDLRLSVHFLEKPSWVSFVKTINWTMLARAPHAPKPTTANISTSIAGPSQPTTVRSAANASPGRKKKSNQPSLFIPPNKRNSPPPMAQRQILTTSPDSLHPPGRQTAQADVVASEQDVPMSGYKSDSYKPSKAFDPIVPLESRKPRQPNRFADTWTADNTDRDSTTNLARLDSKKKKVVKKPKLPPTARAGPSTTREDLEANAKEIVAVGRNVRAQASATEFTIEILQCNIGTGKIPLSQGDLPKQCTIAITAEMAPTESYKKAVILKEDIFFPMIEFEPSGRKTMMFSPPLSFHLPQHIFRTLPSNWPFPNDRGYRKGNFMRLRIEFLSFVDKDRKPSQWILDEFGDYTNDEKDQVFQCPVAAIPLIKPTRDGDMQRQDLHGNRAQLSIGGMTLNPEPFFSFKFQNYWDAATAAAASAVPLPKPKRERHKTPKKGPQVHVQPATEVKKKGKGPLVLDEEEDEEDEEDSSNDNDALEGLQSATGGMHLDNSDDSRAVTPSSREISPAFEDDDNKGFGRIRQAFTIVFNPTAPTFHPPPRPPVPRDTQQIHKGTLAHDIAALDRDSVDLETIEREEAIFFFEGIHDGQKFVMALWNRWCSSYGRIHQLNSDAHIKGFISRYFNVLHQKRVRVFLVIHLQILAAFDLCTNDTFAMAMALYTRCVQQSLRQSRVLPPLPA